jgi:hypothetical protein
LVVVDRVGDRPHGHASLLGLAQVDHEDRHCGLLLHLGDSVVRASRIIQSLCWIVRDPDFLTVDDIAVAAAAVVGSLSCRCRSPARSRPSTAGAMTARDLRQVELLLRLAAWRSVPMLYIWPWQEPALRRCG